MEMLFEGETELRFKLSQGREIRIKVDAEHQSVVVAGAREVDFRVPLERIIPAWYEEFTDSEDQLVVRTRVDDCSVKTTILRQRGHPWWSLGRPPFICASILPITERCIRLFAGFEGEPTTELGSQPLAAPVGQYTPPSS